MDKSTAARQIELLTGSPETPCNFRLIHDKGRAAPARKLYGSLDAVWPAIAEANGQGYGVFIVPNEGGDADADITKVRALFIDADNAPPPDAFHMPPSFIVRRDETHWHAYWTCDDLSPGEFKQAQKRLITYYKSDPTICNPARVMRLAGTDHHKTDRIIPITLHGPDPWDARTYLSRDVTHGLPEPKAEAEVRTVAAVKELDLPPNVSRAVLFAKGLPVLRAGVQDYSDDHAIGWLRQIGDLGVSEAKAADILYEHWGTRCNFDREWIEEKARNAYKNRANALGVDAVQSSHEAFGDTLKALIPPRPAFPKYYGYAPGEFLNWPEPTWLIPDVIPERGLCLWFGKPGTYKSFIALDMALRLAAGLPVFGYTPARKYEIYYAAGESPTTIGKWRVPAWGMGTGTEIPDSFRLSKDVPLLVDPQSFLDLVTQIKAQGLKPDLIVIDTVAASMAGTDDSSFKDASSFVLGMKLLRDAFNCAILAIHHTKKDGSEERGSGDFIGSTDVCAKFTGWENRAVAMQTTKMRDAEIRLAPWTFHGTKVGKGLVFRPTSEAEHAEHVMSAELFSQKAVGNALAVLGTKVTSAVLADQILLHDKKESPEARQARIKRACELLHKLAQTSLRAYCEGTSPGGFLWSLGSKP